MIASWQEFFDLTAEVRQCQREYFRDPNQLKLIRSKAKEKELDAAIEQHKKQTAKL
jgi:hypothetical protein